MEETSHHFFSKVGRCGLPASGRELTPPPRFSTLRVMPQRFTFESFDASVYELYGLTPDEIILVEDHAK